MSSAYDKLRRILVLERDQGYLDRAVMGGLSRFLTYWAKEAREEAERVVHPVPVDEVMAALDGYAGLSVGTRSQAVDRLLEQLSKIGTAQAVLDGAAPNKESAKAGPRSPSSQASDSPDTAVAQSPEGRAPRSEGAAQPGPFSLGPAPPGRPSPGGRTAAEDKLTLNSPVTVLRGVSSVYQRRLARLGIREVQDLLCHIPRRYDDFAELKTINRLAVGDEVTVVGTVQETRAQGTRRGMTVVRVILSDGTGSVELRWFNQPYLTKQLRVGREIVVSGKVDEYLGRLVFNAPEWESLARELLHTGRLVPVYPLTEGIRARWLRRLTKDTLDSWIPRTVDMLPPSVLESANLIDLSTALRQIHFPDSRRALEEARQRLCFDEFFILQLGILRHRHVWRSQRGRAFRIPRQEIGEFVRRLPFRLTRAQERAIDAILSDLQRSEPMSRLLQGDVGSGKTVVAVVAMLAAVHNEYQAAIMAPTSILAEQHYDTVSRLLEQSEHVRCGLLVGSLPAQEKRRVQEGIRSGSVQVIVGTHALIQDTVDFARLGLVVVDEQHRFGVAQRGALRGRGDGTRPHLLAMSATPIPRTLALTLYGDLDISALNEMPPDRQAVATAVRSHRSRERIYSFVNAQIAQGRQAFVICPLVEELDTIDAKAAVAEHQRLQQDVFPHLRVGLLHGRMSREEKEQTMAAFKAGDYDLLVSTAVVEVGIDVPNAAVILVEGAERFGLAQLHQFRGRVGRGPHKSYCILLSDDPSEQSLERLRIMEETCDGFVLAEKDLAMRGPGDFFGLRQHGLPELKVAKLSDTATLEKARREALRLFEEDPDLGKPEHQALAASVRRFWALADLS